MAARIGIPSVRRKSFLVQPLNGEDDAPQKATIETVSNPALAHVADLPQAVRKVYEEEFAADGLKLTMPDGSEWYIEDDVWESMLQAVRENRDYLRATKDGGED